MDEPTIPERLRDLQADVTRILVNLDTYVTQEQRATDKELADLKLAAVASSQATALEAIAKAVAEQKTRTDTMKNLVWTAVVAPVIVGFILYLLIGKTP